VKEPLGRPRRRWVDNIRTDLQEVGCRYMDWIGLAEDRDRWRTLQDFLIDCTNKPDYSTCTGALYPTVNQQGRETEYSPPFTTAFATVSNCVWTVSAGLIS